MVKNLLGCYEEIGKTHVEKIVIIDFGSTDKTKETAVEIVDFKWNRKKKNKTQNMPDRFINYKDQVLGFARNFLIPFGNNITEQAIRA